MIETAVKLCSCTRSTRTQLKTRTDSKPESLGNLETFLQASLALWIRSPEGPEASRIAGVQARHRQERGQDAFQQRQAEPELSLILSGFEVTMVRQVLYCTSEIFAVQGSAVK